MQNLYRRHGSPLLVGSRATVREQLRRLRQSLPAVEWLFAVKANSDLELIATLALEGCGFDIASHSEWQQVQRAIAALELEPPDGLYPPRIPLFGSAIQHGRRPDVLHSHPCKHPRDIEACFAAGLRDFVFDGESELVKLAEHAPQSRLLMRLNVPHRSGQVPFSHRFGAELESVIPLARQAKGLGMLIEGLAFHIGSQALDASDFDAALDVARQAWTSLEADGFQISKLDIGGGFPVGYRDQKVMPLEAYCGSIVGMLKRHFGPLGIKVIGEPGRILCAEAVWLLVSVIGKQRRQGKWWYTIDDGKYGSFSGRYFSESTFDFFPYRLKRHRPETRSTSEGNFEVKPLAADDAALEPSMIAGPTCDGGDIVAADFPLPELEIGDLLVATPLGAYAAVCGGDFNGIPRAKRIWLD